jgi:hypothetical protein
MNKTGIYAFYAFNLLFEDFAVKTCWIEIFPKARMHYITDAFSFYTTQFVGKVVFYFTFFCFLLCNYYK